MTDRYVLRSGTDADTWSVVDIFTDLPVEMGGKVMAMMDADEADDLVDLLNHLDQQKRAES